MKQNTRILTILLLAGLAFYLYRHASHPSPPSHTGNAEYMVGSNYYGDTKALLASTHYKKAAKSFCQSVACGKYMTDKGWSNPSKNCQENTYFKTCMDWTKQTRVLDDASYNGGKETTNELKNYSFTENDYIIMLQESCLFANNFIYSEGAKQGTGPFGKPGESPYTCCSTTLTDWPPWFTDTINNTDIPKGYNNGDQRPRLEIVLDKKGEKRFRCTARQCTKTIQNGKAVLVSEDDCGGKGCMDTYTDSRYIGRNTKNCLEWETKDAWGICNTQGCCDIGKQVENTDQRYNQWTCYDNTYCYNKGACYGTKAITRAIRAGPLRFTTV